MIPTLLFFNIEGDVPNFLARLAQDRPQTTISAAEAKGVFVRVGQGQSVSVAPMVIGQKERPAGVAVAELADGESVTSGLPQKTRHWPFYRLTKPEHFNDFISPVFIQPMLNDFARRGVGVDECK